jgi:hypothetical protein
MRSVRIVQCNHLLPEIYEWLGMEPFRDPVPFPSRSSPGGWVCTMDAGMWGEA